MNSISDIVSAFIFRMLFFLLILAAGLLGAQTLTAHEASGETKSEGSVVVQGGDFILNSPEGPLSLKDLRGKVVLLFFGYTSCPDICPISLATIADTFSKLTDDELKRMQSFFISLDPERDTPERLKKFTGYFHPNIVGVTGKPEVVAAVADHYGVRFERKVSPTSALGYVIYHTANIFVVGPDGELRNTFPHNTDAQPLLQQIKSLLNIDQ